MSAEEKQPFDPKLAEGIAYFEQMLQVMPDDRTTLEFLCVAYGQLGERDKQRKALVSLANALLKEGDLAAAASIAERLAAFTEPDAQAAVLRVRAAGGLQTETPAETPTAGRVAAPLVADAVAAERALVAQWRAQKVVNDALADTVLQRLDELAGLSGVFLVSALAILEKENAGAAETAAAWLADVASAPPVPLELFEAVRDLAPRLETPLVRTRGVVPFARLGPELLVATLNPLDTALKRDVAAAAACPCRFYLAHPRTLEDILERLFADNAASADATPQEG